MINISILYVFEEKYLAIISEFLWASDRILRAHKDPDQFFSDNHKFLFYL